ncbi:carbohydrate sulfotransferase 10 isoform X2 [Takifugu rubripes]|uniref:carbohydrate sulfotransferase 10 isoform X2 n=1 Tax=Takifugu rubripes TaxID=31033 RepID=UPI00114571AB|nr:carbohydrate sulfotransferase 10 isoform X2 [Takifugu rubripes]XP_056882247.1 carbohydrate sulfotransferase 10 isoform X2 [Takifugu flavidus]
MRTAMRHHWLLLGACGWVLLILMFASKFISFRAIDDYGDKLGAHSWTVPGPNGAKSAPVSSPKHLKLGPGPSDQLPTIPPDLDWHSVAEERINLLSTACKNSTLGNLTHISISAFSSVEEIPENLVHDHEKNGLPRLSSLPPREITHRLSTYFKFLIVRDPFERLISAFKDKFVKNPRFEPWYKHDIAPAIIRKYRKSHRYSDTTASGLHFEDFVRYLGDVDGRRRVDRQFGEHIIHWVTYAELCAPCEIHYSVIGHHETLEQDAPYILKAAGIEQVVSYPAIPPGITRYNRTKVESYFSGISKRDIRRLYTRYQGDFYLFGYPSPDFLMN